MLKRIPPGGYALALAEALEEMPEDSGRIDELRSKVRKCFERPNDLEITSQPFSIGELSTTRCDRIPDCTWQRFAPLLKREQGFVDANGTLQAVAAHIHEGEWGRLLPIAHECASVCRVKLITPPPEARSWRRPFTHRLLFFTRPETRLFWRDEFGHGFEL